MPRIALKNSIPFFAAENAIHFRLSGNLTSLEDPDGRVLALLKLLDGQRDEQGVCAELSLQYPDVSLAEVREAIEELDRSGLVQNAEDAGDDFGAADRKRWSNNLGFFETYATMSMSKYEYQRRIRDAKVAVLGVGGVGTHVLIDLIAIGFTDVRIVDFDAVDLSNLNRQILYGESFLGKYKTDIAAMRVRDMNSKVQLDVQCTKLLSAQDVYEVVRDREIVVGSVDGPKVDIVHWLNAGCVRAGAALLTGGVEAQRALLATIVPGVSGCVECWYDEVRATDQTSAMLLEAMRETADRGESFGEDTAAFNGLVTLLSAHMVGEVVRLATRLCPPLSVGTALEMTFHDPQLRAAETFSRRAGCATCKDAEPAEGLRWLRDADLPALPSAGQS